jgi:hypothetical protein
LSTSVSSAKRTRNAHLTSPKVKIEVTQEIIDESCQRDSSHCMVAEALKAAVPRAQYISVDLATIRFTDVEAGMRYIYLTPRRVQQEILNFDQGEKSEPFNFRIQGAHILPTGNARKARASLQASGKAAADPLSTAAKGYPPGNLPTRVGGQAPPIGPLPGGAPVNKNRSDNKNVGAGSGNRTGKRREFGLRAIIR